MLSKSEVFRLKDKLPHGTEIEFFDKAEISQKATVDYIDADGGIHVRKNNGKKYSFMFGEINFRIVSHCVMA
ncbi:MAG: hypothetical protein Q4C42_04505 [Clostridia bacterium]|nr:hypothetical protein [Clostridia bacterium]